MSALYTLNMDVDELGEFIERLTDEAPSTATVMAAMMAFLTDTNEHVDELLAETIDMRRSHLALLLALIEDARARLAAVLKGIDLDGRLPDADLADPVHDGLATTGEALTVIVDVLNRNPHQ